MAKNHESIETEAHKEPFVLQSFYQAMSRLGAGVSIVTTNGLGGRCGLTVTSVTSVSSDPPIILTCINHDTRTCDVLTENHVFAVNVLSKRHENLSNAFAGRSHFSPEERFAHAEWDEQHAGTGAPLLKGARATLDCKVIDRIDSGTHRVFFGQVVGIQFGEREAALLYLDRDYRTL